MWSNREKTAPIYRIANLSQRWRQELARRPPTALAELHVEEDLRV
jgi:hypothetical protein